MRLAALRLLAEGGAVGHLMHLYDNPDITFAEIKGILSSAASGNLQKVTEKFDGLNLVFTWDATAGQLRVARSAGDIEGGGMDAAALTTKFAGRGNLTKAFTSAFQILKGAVGAIPPRQLAAIFGAEGDRWYSIEVIYTENPNVINYDSNTIVFHQWPIFEIQGGKVQTADDTSGAEALASYVDRMQAAIANRGWQVTGPAVVRLSKISNKTILSNAMGAIDTAVESIGLDDSATIQQYISACFSDDLADLGLNAKVAKMTTDRAAGVPGAPTLNDIRKFVDKSQYETVSTFIKASPKLRQGYIRPIELAINDFAAELLKGLQSTLIDDPEAEVNRLRQATSDAITAIESSGDENAMQVLKTQMEKLKSLENITSSVEGVVFIYKGNAYKFTGSFAAANKILGIFRYSRT